MKRYFVLQVSEYASVTGFGAAIVEVLNRNWSSLSEAQEATLNSQENVKNLLTFPHSPYSGTKYAILRNGVKYDLPFQEFFLGCDGREICPQEIEQEEDYNNIQLGHGVAEVDEWLLKQVKFLTAESGYSGSTIAIEIKLDRHRAPKAAVCRLTTPDDYSGNYAKHFIDWAEAHNMELKDGQW